MRPVAQYTSTKLTATAGTPTLAARWHWRSFCSFLLALFLL